MVSADLVRFLVFCTLPFATSAGQIVVLAAVAGLATGFFRPAVYAGLPNLVEDDELPSAQGLLQAADAVTTVLGPLIGGVLVAATSPDWAYVLNAITFLFSAVLILRIPARLLQVAQASTEGHWRDIAAGLRLIGSSRALLTVLIAWNVGMLGNAGVNVGEVVLAKVSFNAGDFGYGLLLATAGFGLVFGSLSAGVWLERLDLPRVYGGGFVLMAIGIGARRGGAERLGRRRVRHRLGRGQRGGGRLQRGARPARGSRRDARARVHGADELELRRARARDGRWRDH